MDELEVSSGIIDLLIKGIVAKEFEKIVILSLLNYSVN